LFGIDHERFTHKHRGLEAVEKAVLIQLGWWQMS